VASIKTEATELAVAFGLLGVDPTVAEFSEVAARFEGTLTQEKFDIFKRACTGRYRDLCRLLYCVAQDTKEHCPGLLPEGANVRWLGPLQQSRSVTTPQDLVMSATAISVKVNSWVVFNLSPYNLFVSVPSGLVSATRTENWYSTMAPEAYQELFELVRAGTNFATIVDFDRDGRGPDRKRLQNYIRGLGEMQTDEFNQKYIELCTQVSLESADVFNQNLERTLETVHGSALQDELLRYFLRLDAMPYLLIGLERNRPFSILVPSITEWKRGHQFERLVAEADTDAGQSVVRFNLVVYKRRPRGRVELPFHAEIRWSHGKFCGNPEGKLYRDFRWEEAPGLTTIIGPG
jgi:hypothetical protein